MLKHLFVMDPLDGIKAWKDTSYYLMLAGSKLNHRIYHCEPSDIFFNQKVSALVSKLQLTDYQESQPTKTLVKVESNVPFVLDDFDYIWIRKDPPFDSNYLYLSLLLDRVKKAKIINKPQALRDWNEKLAILPYLKYSPASIVTSKVSVIMDYLKQNPGEYVLKPLDGFGGRGIDFISSKQEDLKDKLNKYLEKLKAPIMLQKYVEKATEGDKRVLIWNGKILGAILRKNASGSKIHNLDAGAKALPTQLTQREKSIANEIIIDLDKAGLYFVGLDFLGEQLSEINVTSPTGLQELCRFEKQDYHLEIMQSLP